ncbi:deaminase [filamentous cyanobacterium CCP5]|nr:deaminase [filamentous cyanobacterium CCP5]
MQCSVFIATSLDGFIARTNGAIDWLSLDTDSVDSQQEDYGYQQFFDSVDALVMGRNTYEIILAFPTWPYDRKPVIVLSQGHPNVPASLQDRIEIMAAAPDTVMQHCAERGFHRIYIDGGQTIQRFLRMGLIHDITLTRIPILIGEGIPLFGALADDVRLEHLSTQVFAQGLVQSQYRIHSGD